MMSSAIENNHQPCLLQVNNALYSWKGKGQKTKSGPNSDSNQFCGRSQLG